MSKIKSLIVLCALAICTQLSAQNVNEMLINEVLVKNETSLVDGFGNRNGWIELLNSSYGTVDIGGCYISVTKSGQKETRYLIPKGDVNTKIAPRQVIVLFASGNGDQGTFYTNFRIEAGDMIKLISNDGRTLIDSVRIPANLGIDQSYGRVHIEGTIDDTEFQVLVPSPNSQNGDLEAETKSQIMARTDPYGWIISLTSMSVVFISLIVLFLIFKLIGKISVKYMEKKVAYAVSRKPSVFFFQKGMDTNQARTVNAQIGTRLVEINPLGYDWKSEIRKIADALSR